MYIEKVIQSNGAAYVPILLSEDERAYTIYDPVLGGEKNIKCFKRFAGAKTLQRRNNSISKLSIHFRSRFSLTQKFDPKIPHP